MDGFDVWYLMRMYSFTVAVGDSLGKIPAIVVLRQCIE